MYELILIGALAYSVMVADVAEHRLALNQIPNYAKYDVLVAPSDCSLIGKEGWLIVDDRIYSALVVDCEADVHKGQMDIRGILADVNIKDMSHKQGRLLIWK